MVKQQVTAEDWIKQSPPFDPAIETEDIEIVPKLEPKGLDLEAFMNEMVTVYVHESTDANATPAVEVSVNGRRVIIPRGINFPVKRMYVERLARAKKTTITQNLDPSLGEGVNRLQKHRGMDYPFQMVEDRNPIGAEWLKRILAEP